MLANSYLLVAFDFVTYSGGLVALGADRHYLAGVKCAFSLDDTAKLTLSAGLDVLGHHVSSFNDDLSLFGGNFQHLALFAFILTGDDHYFVAFFNV